MSMKRESYAKKIGRRASNSIINAARKISNDSGALAAPQLEGFSSLLRAKKLEIEIDNSTTLLAAEEKFCFQNRCDFDMVLFKVNDVSNNTSTLLYHAELHAQGPYGFLVKDPFNANHSKLMQVSLLPLDTLKHVQETVVAKIQTGTALTLFRICRSMQVVHNNKWAIRRSGGPDSRSNECPNNNAHQETYLQVDENTRILFKLLSCLGFSYESTTNTVQVNGITVAFMKPKIGCMLPKKTLTIQLHDDCPQDEEMRGVILGVGLLITLKHAYPTLAVIIEEAFIRKVSSSHTATEETIQENE